jgi:ABC-type sugar transport system ATPase subunit
VRIKDYISVLSNMIEGVEHEHFDLSSVRHHPGGMSDRHRRLGIAVEPHMSVAENIAFGLRARRVPAAERERRIGDIANVVGLGDHLNVRPGELSGGEHQRVALARALALQPRILLMDEPLSNLDAALSRRLRPEILRLHAELAFTLVYVTHSRDEAQDIGMRTIELIVAGAQ